MLAKLQAEHQKNPDSIDTNRAIAKYYLGNDMEEEAEPYLVKMLEIDDRMASIHNQLAVIYFRRAQYAKAEHHFRRALQVDFRMAEAHFNLAFLYQTQGRYAEALTCYKEAANLDHKDSEVYRLMGQCAQAEGMLQEAETLLLESFRLSPRAETALDLSILYVMVDKYPEAEVLLNFLLDLIKNGTVGGHSQSAQPHTAQNTDGPDSGDGISDSQLLQLNLSKESLDFTLALVLAKQGKYMNAIKHLRDVVMVNNRNAQAYNYLGECCAAIGLEKEGESFFARASKLDPQYLKPIMNLGKLYYNQGKYRKVISAIEQYIKVRRELADAQSQEIGADQNSEIELMYELLGRAYQAVGNREKAIEIWKESLEANPDQPGLISLVDGLPSPAYRKTVLSIED